MIHKLLLVSAGLSLTTAGSPDGGGSPGFNIEQFGPADLTNEYGQALIAKQ